MSVLRIAIPTPLRRLFDYLPPQGMDEAQLKSLLPGQRLRVPFGSRQVTGYLVSVYASGGLEASKLKRVDAILESQALLPAALVELCNWAARYYHHPVGEVYGAAFPRSLRTGKPHQREGIPGWKLSIRGQGLPEGALARSPRQAQALALLQSADAISNRVFKDTGISQAVLRELQKKKLADRCLLPAAGHKPLVHGALKPNPEQAEALDKLSCALSEFSCHLLEGVTGSGKTEIYLQLIAQCLDDDKQALVLVPEIGLTPQTLERFRSRFSAKIVAVHSGLGEAERYRAWEAARDGSADIVIGTRSAIFTPLQAVGLIIVDEEHDGSYKQQDGFRYSARDVAVKRGQLENCLVLLGSATPSLESLHNVALGRYFLHRLTSRAGGSQMPAISAIDIRRQELRAGLSTPLLAAADRTLGSGQQVLLFLNRRGYAPTLQCHDCGWVAECKHCDARMTVHRRPAGLRCHHCAASQGLPQQCPQCLGSSLMTTGLGTEQTEAYLRDRFQSWPVFRVDSDSMQGRHAMSNLVEEVGRGEPCILLGTQMLTKGHHFPGVSLVAIVDVDALLFSADFRGEERMAQLLTQVAGRAGRADTPGQVLLQTHYPDHPAVQAMLTLDYSEQARVMLANRQAAGMPPSGQLVVLRSDCEDAARGEQFLHEVKDKLATKLTVEAHIIGPLPSPLQRRAGKFRHQLVLLLAGRREAQIAAGTLVVEAEASKLGRKLKWTLDVDPQDLY